MKLTLKAFITEVGICFYLKMPKLNVFVCSYEPPTQSCQGLFKHCILHFDFFNFLCDTLFPKYYLYHTIYDILD